MKLAFRFIALSAGAAQVPTPVSLAKPLLQAASLHDKAWGAWLAGASHDPAFREPLIEQLRQANAGTDDFLIRILLDELIELGGPVPNDAVLPFENSRRAEVLILMSRSSIDSAAEDALLDIREQNIPESQWTAINHLLFAASSKKFFQRTFEELVVTHHFLMYDGNGGVFGSGSGGGVSCCGGAGLISKDLPIIASYALTSAPSPGDVLLVSKPVPLYYTRSPGGCEWFNAVDRQALTTRFFSAIIGRPAEQIEMNFHSTTRVATAAQIQDALTTQAMTIRALIADAQQRGLVEASGMHLPIAITIEDLRRDRTVPLPSPYEIVIP
jgi:hypothetical protein